MTLLPAVVVSKRRGDGPERHYLCGPQRETREEAEKDLAAWEAMVAESPEEPVVISSEQDEAFAP